MRSLAEAAASFADDPRKLEPCQAALRHVQAYAVNAGDGPLMRGCAAFSLQLSSGNVRTDAGRAAVEACAAGVRKLVSLKVGEAAQREQIAETIRQAVGRAAAQRAA